MRRILLVGLTFWLCACGNDLTVGLSPNPTPASIAGSYGLNTVDGFALPFSVLDVGAYHIQIASGSLALNANMTYALKFGLRVDDSGNIRADADSDAGTWSLTDHALSFTSSQGNFAPTGTVSGNVITMQSSTRVLVFGR